jgi:hypothetical protein
MEKIKSKQLCTKEVTKSESKVQNYCNIIDSGRLKEMKKANKYKHLSAFRNCGFDSKMITKYYFLI